MLLWNDFVDQSKPLKHAKQPNQDDLKLLQIYLCRLFLAPSAEGKFDALASAHPETTFSGDPACPGKMSVSEKLRNTRDA